MWARTLIDVRRWCAVRYGIIATDGRQLGELVTAMGLIGEAESLILLSAEKASATLALLIGFSLVDGREAVSRELVDGFVTGFFNDVDLSSTIFYTNGVWDGSGPTSWTPMTNSVLDGGIMAFGPKVSSCLWIEEDA